MYDILIVEDNDSLREIPDLSLLTVALAVELRIVYEEKGELHARSLPEEVQLGPPDLAAAGRHDIEHVGRMERELPLDALVAHDPPDGEALIDAAAFAGDDRAGENLRAGLVAFLDPAMDVHRIAHLEVRDLLLQTLALNTVQ